MATLSDLRKRFGEPLLERNNAGIKVALFWDRSRNEVWIGYEDIATKYTFSFDPPKDLAIRAYEHPIFYADAQRNGKSNPERLIPQRLVPEAV